MRTIDGRGRSGAAEQRFAARHRERLLQPRRLGARDVAAERRQLVRTAPLIVFRRRGRLADEALVQQALADPLSGKVRSLRSLRAVSLYTSFL